MIVQGIVVMILPTFEGFYNPLIHFNFVTYDFKNITISSFFIVSIFLLELLVKVIFFPLLHLLLWLLDDPLFLENSRSLSFPLLLSLIFYLLEIFLWIFFHLGLLFYFSYFLLYLLLSSCIINVFLIQFTYST